MTDMSQIKIITSIITISISLTIIIGLLIIVIKSQHNFKKKYENLKKKSIQKWAKLFEDLGG